MTKLQMVYISEFSDSYDPITCIKDNVAFTEQAVFVWCIYSVQIWPDAVTCYLLGWMKKKLIF